MRRIRHHAKRVGKHLIDHFVPHEGNQHHPHVLKHRVLVGYSVVLVLLKALALIVPVVLPSSSLYSSAITPQNIISLTNQTRENLELSSLAMSDKLQQAAQAKAEDMAANQYFAHTSPAGVTPWSWFGKVGYKYLVAGENLAVHFSSAEGVAEGWMASPSHRANIVNPRYTEIGIGVAMGEFEGYATTFVVQMFGLPVSAAQPAASVAVTAPPTTAPAQPAQTGGQVAAAEQQTEPVQPEAMPEPVTEPKLDIPASGEPVEEIPEALPELAYDESATVVTQLVDSYHVRVTIGGADSVTAHLAGEVVPLTREAEDSNVWQGQVPYDATTMSRGGERLMVEADSSSGRQEIYAVAWVAPKAPTQQVYTFNEGEQRYAKVFGLTIPNMQDEVRKIYFYFVVFLASALLINILVKVRIQKLPVIGHAAFVLALGLLLMAV